MSIEVKELLEAGVHFGHQTRRWCPQMKQYIFAARNGIHIIDLDQTIKQLDAACEFMAKHVKKGSQILFVGTKKQAQAAIKETAEATKQLYITQRWLGGALTNFNTGKKSIKRLESIEKMEADGSINNFGKKEQASLKREAARLSKNLDGMRTMQKPPAVMFIVDIKREHNALSEAHKLNIPVVALVDTNSDPTQVDYPIPGNDDAIRSIRAILGVVSQALEGIKVEAATPPPAPEPVAEEKTPEVVTPPPAPEVPAAPVIEPPAGSTITTPVQAS